MTRTDDHLRISVVINRLEIESEGKLGVLECVLKCVEGYYPLFSGRKFRLQSNLRFRKFHPEISVKNLKHKKKLDFICTVVIRLIFFICSSKLRIFE